MVLTRADHPMRLVLTLPYIFNLLVLVILPSLLNPKF